MLVLVLLVPSSIGLSLMQQIQLSLLMILNRMTSTMMSRKPTAAIVADITVGQCTPLALGLRDHLVPVLWSLCFWWICVQDRMRSLANPFFFLVGESNDLVTHAVPCLDGELLLPSPCPGILVVFLLARGQQVSLK